MKNNLQRRFPSFFSREELFSPLEDHFHKIFDSIFSDKNFDVTTSGYPKLDAYDKDGNFVIEAAIPGVNENNIKIEMDGDILKLSGEVSEEHKNSNENYYVHELKKSKFSRTVRIPENVEGDPVAELKDGILNLSWKYKQVEQKKSKLIEIKKV